jgi:hypothetical protein
MREEDNILLFYAVLCLAVVGLGFVLWLAWKFAVRGVARLKRRLKKTQGWIGKVLRHAPTGRIGYCTSTSHTLHPRWRGIGAKLMAQIVTCPKCAQNFKSHGPLHEIGASVMGHAELLPLSELTAALPCEQAEFLQRMESGEELA